jgi:hypothetical protein
MFVFPMLPKRGIVPGIQGHTDRNRNCLGLNGIQEVWGSTPSAANPLGIVPMIVWYHVFIFGVVVAYPAAVNGAKRWYFRLTTPS